MGAKILVVDDELQIRKLLRVTLQAHGFTLLERATGSDGVVCVGMERPDLVVLDLGLPDMDYMPETIEEKIVACADNLIIGNRRIDINEQVERYKNKGLDKAAIRIRELYEYVSSEAKMDINEIEI